MRHRTTGRDARATNRKGILVRESIPLRERKIDYLLLGFFWFNLVFITYMFDIEQVIVTDTSLAGTSEYVYPPWPPAWVVDLSYWWGRNFDELLMARPMFWRMTIWIDQLFFGPFYIAAIYAFTKGKDWIRIPSIIWASVLMTNVTIILGEEFYGQWAAETAAQKAAVVAANASWFLVPMYVIYRMWTAGEHPFTRPVNAK